MVESESEIEENKEDKGQVDKILDSFEKEGDLEFVDSLVTEEKIKENLQNEEKLDCNWNFAENMMGLVIKDKFKRKRKGNYNTGKRKKVTYLDLSKCVASEEDTLPDINTQEFAGAQRNDEDILDQRKDFTGAHFTGALVTGFYVSLSTLNDDDWIVTVHLMLQAHKFLQVHIGMLQVLQKRTYFHLQVLQVHITLQVHNLVLQAPKKRIYMLLVLHLPALIGMIWEKHQIE